RPSAARHGVGGFGRFADGSELIGRPWYTRGSVGKSPTAREARMGRWLGVACTSTLALVVAAHGCAASESSGGSGGSGGSAGSGGGISTDGAAGDDGGLNPDAACNKFSAEAKQAPAAILFVVDGSASMSQSQKWGTAQLATVTAIDQDAFDGVSLGLVRFPA